MQIVFDKIYNLVVYTFVFFNVIITWGSVSSIILAAGGLFSLYIKVKNDVLDRKKKQIEKRKMELEEKILELQLKKLQDNENKTQ